MTQGDEPTVPDSSLRDAALFRRIGMTLLAEEPEVAESIASHRLALEELLRRGEGAIRYDGSSDSPTYIVLKNGTRYTSQTRPSDIPEDRMIDQGPEDLQATAVWDRLNEVYARLKVDCPEIVEGLWIDQAVEFIGSIRTSGSIIGEVAVHQVLSQALRRHTHYTRSAEAACACSIDAVNAIGTEYKKLRLPGCWAKKYVAVLTFFSVHPDAATLYSINESEAKKLLGSTIGTFPVQGIPTSDIGYYLTHPESEGYKSFIAANGAARLLRRLGKQMVLEALSQPSLGMFHEILYSASINYLAAQEIYRRILLLGDSIPIIWKWIKLTDAEVRSLWVETEEARVTIGSSLMSAALSHEHLLSVMDPIKFFGYLVAALEREGYDRARSIVHDLLARLICPEVLHDLALVLIDVIAHRSGERTLRRARAVLLQLEGSVRINRAMGDPNFLPLAYSLIVAVLRDLGRDDEAQVFAEKSRSNSDGFPDASAGSLRRESQADCRENVSINNMI
jgi:hypothetical protein